MTSAKSSCSVCGEQLSPEEEAFCGECGKPYHLNQRQDRPGKDCGQVWINEEHMALEFACNSCLFPVPEGDSLEDVLDAAEAAAVAGVGAEAVIAAAESGSLRHRRTAGGMYLFQRGDVLAFGARK
jgi:hypothetical protein